MTKFNGFANYGVLAHEKQVIFTALQPAGTATHSEKIEIELPEGFDCGYNAMQELVITAPNGQNYTANEILRSYGDNPVMVWYEGSKERRTKCKFKEIA